MRQNLDEAFKRLKHRLNLEHVTGLAQQAKVQDVAAKIVCDNLQALVALTAHAEADLPSQQAHQPCLRPHRAQAADVHPSAWLQDRQDGWQHAALPTGPDR